MRAWGVQERTSYEGESPSGPSKRPAIESPTGEQNEGSASTGTPAIKRRLIRPKAIRRTSDTVPNGSLQSGPSSEADDASDRRPTTFDSSKDEDTQVEDERTNGTWTNDAPVAANAEPSLSPTPQDASQSLPPANNDPSPVPSAPRPRGPPPRSHLVPLRTSHPPLLPCRSVYNYTRLNHIEEGTYGVVFRAKCNDTGGIYALKKLKLEEEKQGFPITSLREVMALMVAGNHENVVGIREIVVGDTLNQIFIVMPFIEHDLKTLLADMPHPFLQSEVKTIMLQLLSAVAHCHANWILHRDLKTSNLLINNRGQIKVADFGLARKFGDPLGEMTQLVVTLWYRCPELLLGATEYTTAVDVWSCGCILAELMQGQALFPGKGEIDQINRIFSLLGQPNEDVWPGYNSLPLSRKINPVGPAFSTLRQKFKHLSSEGHNLLSSLLCYDPTRRIGAEEAGKHPYFSENPMPKHSDLFPSFPSQAAGERRHKSLVSPSAPVRFSHAQGDLADLESFV